MMYVCKEGEILAKADKQLAHWKEHFEEIN